MHIQTNVPGHRTSSASARRNENNHRLADVRETIERQALAVAGLAKQLDEGYSQAVELILGSKGRLVICGMGKSGLIGRKLAATFSSTGTPSFFLHPGEAIHGDLGMVMPEDTVMLISYSGETDEVLRLLPLLRRSGNPIIALVGKRRSTLGEGADVVLQAAVESEVCPNGLAPTTSTLAAMALGDALAVTLINERAFSPLDFAHRHPGGSLGRSLLTKVRDEMRSDHLPVIEEGASVADCVCTISTGRLGLAVVVRAGRAVGIVTDGDLRRALARHTDLSTARVREIMTPCPRTVGPNEMVVDAEERLKREKVKALIVVDDAGSLVGVFDIFRK